MLALGSLGHAVAVGQTIWRQRLKLMRTMLDKMVARGEFPDDAGPVPLLETLIAPLYLRAQVTAVPPEAWRSDEMIDCLLAAFPVSRWFYTLACHSFCDTEPVACPPRRSLRGADGNLFRT